MTLPTARSYCTGYIGLEMAVRSAFGKFQVLSHSDIKSASTVLLAHRFPNTPNLGNMRTIDYGKLEPPDLMIGSWPCQPHSSAGLQLGEEDPRDLWPEYLRAIDAHRPAMFFGENVGRIARNGELRRVILSLAERGYVGAWRCVRASDIGACHQRERCFVVAIASDRINNSEYLYQWNNGKHLENVSTKRTLMPTPTKSDTFGPGYSQLAGGMNLRTVVSLLPSPCERDYREGSEFVARPEKVKLPHTIKALSERRLLPPPTVGDSRNTRNATANRSPGQNHHAGWTLSDVAYAEVWDKYADAIIQHEYVLGRLAPDHSEMSPKTGKGQLSAQFVEWMMMLPNGWVTDVPNYADSPRKSERNAMISLLGDGVVPAQGAYAFRWLLAHLAARLISDRQVAS